jgi:uncharacterized membrane protein
MGLHLETNMTGFQAVVALAAFLCSLTAGFLFAFAAVGMPGLRSLDDGAFIRAFQAIDRVIQNNQPLFILVWVGSTLAVIAAAGMGLSTLSGADRALVVGAALIYLLGVQLPTATINVPMNNALQKLDSAAMDATAVRRARADFEPRWNRWNIARTACASLASALLILAVLRL